MRARNHVAESAEVLLSQPAFHGGEYPGDLATAAENFSVIENILRLEDARDGNFLALETSDVVFVLFGSHQLVVAAAHKLQQVVQELGHVGGPDVVLET